MTLFQSARRSSERFAEVLDFGISRHWRHRRGGSYRELQQFVGLTSALSRIRTAPAPEPEFRDGLRAMLMATAEREGIGQSDDPTTQIVPPAALAAAVAAGPRRSASTRARAAALVGVMVGALTLSGVSAASTAALPGDPLYQVKRSAEQAQLALAGSDLSRGRLYLEFADDRLNEATEVDPDRVGDVLSEMDSETILGVHLLADAAANGDAGAADSIRTFLASQRGRLDAFAAARPGRAAPVLRSIALLDEVGTRTNAIARARADGCPFESPDRLGPKPASPC